MTLFVKNGNTFRPTDEENLDIHNELPAGNYVIKTDQFGNMFFETVDSFEFTSKRYGNNHRNTDRILNTFNSRPASTGIMLAGEKGSGKSLLAKTVSIEAAKQGIPTIIINSPWHGDQFNTFVQNIQQPAILLFDEFEKVYDAEQQESILTLLDGVFPSKKLFLITCNDKWRVDRHMQNRPGRIFYMIDFEGLDADFIREYCVDNLKNLIYIDRIITISGLFSKFNFDMLKALIEEMNRYDESPEESLEFLNVRAEYDSGSAYTVTLTHNTISGIVVTNPKWTGNPLKVKDIHIEYTRPRPTKSKRKGTSIGIGFDDEEDRDWVSTMFSVDNLVSVNGVSGTFTFTNDEGYTLTMERYVEKQFTYGSF